MARAHSAVRRGNRRAQMCDRGATESPPTEAPAERGSGPSRQRDPGAAGLATTPPHPRPQDLPKLPWSPRTGTKAAQPLSGRARNPSLGGASGAGSQGEGGAPNGATARLFREEGRGFALWGGAVDSAPPCSLSRTHLRLGGNCNALFSPTPLGLPASRPFPPASGHTNSQALAAEQPLFFLLVNQAKECFLHRAVLVQLDLDLHRQGLWLVPAFHGWRRRF